MSLHQPEIKNKKLDDIVIKTHIDPGDLGYIIHLHGKLYKEEYDYSLDFEMYVAQGMYEFYKSYNPQEDRVWIATHGSHIAGFLLLMHRENKTAQLRYFLIQPAYRGMGLGKKLMDLYMGFLKNCGYRSAYLWTTNEQHEAAALYKKYGFAVTAEKPSTAFGKPLTEQRYELVL
jgi:ribosomal protein S18 acetylase RimI-like enzyme